MKALWQSFDPRLRPWLMLGAIAVVLLALHTLLWQPLRSWRAELEARYVGAQQDLALLEAAAPALRAGRSVRPSGTEQSLLALADQSARAARLGVALKRIEPVDERQVRLWFEGVVFDALVAWLQELAASHGVRVVEASIDRTAPGSVNARLVLQR